MHKLLKEQANPNPTAFTASAKYLKRKQKESVGDDVGRSNARLPERSKTQGEEEGRNQIYQQQPLVILRYERRIAEWIRDNK